jgi:hypothetical protein
MRARKPRLTDGVRPVLSVVDPTVATYARAANRAATPEERAAWLVKIQERVETLRQRGQLT